MASKKRQDQDRSGHRQQEQAAGKGAATTDALE